MCHTITFAAPVHAAIAAGFVSTGVVGHNL